MDPKNFALKKIYDGSKKNPCITYDIPSLTSEYFGTVPVPESHIEESEHGFKLLLRQGLIQEDQTGQLSLTQKGLDELKSI